MAFVNEIPTEQDIEKYHLPFAEDAKLPMERRRPWVIDRERNLVLWGGGPSGNQAFDDVIFTRFHLWIDDLEFIVLLDRGAGSMKFVENPYVIVWKSIEGITAVRRDLDRQIELPKTAWTQPQVSQTLLGNRSLDEFAAILKQALEVHREGVYGRHISGSVIVKFEF